jgi:uncharacterized protein
MGGPRLAIAMPARVRVPKAAIAEFCRQNAIRKFSLYGSVLRDDFRADSDVDVLVEFEPGALVGLMEMSRMERELSTLFSRKVDLHTPEELSRYFRNEVLQEAEVQFVHG